ncbi:MAG: NTP transferase domain-containing protein [Thermodesulfobacteria bacterium]|nr:NTP transferase domain-containing protein [Thermodesulfobacteriota bacterium]
MKALILAGERGERNPLCEKFGVPFKALLPVCGTPVFRRVLEALEGAAEFDEIYVSAPPELFEPLKGLSQRPLVFFPQAPSPSLSVFQAVERIGHFPIFLTTADHALLTGEIVAYFLQEAREKEGDLGVGVVPYSLVREAYPEARRTTYRLRDGRFCSANLYFISGPNAKRILLLWRQIERYRKNPLRIVRAFGIKPFWKYFRGCLDLQEAFEEVSQALGCHIFPIVLPFARAAVDVDDEDDLSLARKILRCKEG